MSTTKVNVLVYSGAGATLSSVQHATWSLRRLLGPNYAVLTVTDEQILREPWTACCALLVMPGGADLGYCRTLNGEGNRRIRQYVQMGGKYLGLCAGGYYGCARCEFEVGKEGMEVVGDRELAFFPGVCRGLAFPGFVYRSEAGARAAGLRTGRGLRAGGNEPIPETFRVYYNGGGVFVNAERYREKGVEILASYTDELAVDSGEGSAAVVYCKVGQGAAILTGPHPEFSGHNLSANLSAPPNYAAIVAALIADDEPRIAFIKACLTKLGLVVGSSESNETNAPSLTPLHLCAARRAEVAELVRSWHQAGIVSKETGGQRDCIKGEADTFLLAQDGAWDMADVEGALHATTPAASSQRAPAATHTMDYTTVPKTLVAHAKALPSSMTTPSFDIASFFASLAHYEALDPHTQHSYGRYLLYGQVVTSTSTLLEKNPTLLSHLPSGLTATASTQVAGRGRGSNVWVSPPGSLMFSTVLRHSLALSETAPVVFVQYLAALAIVAGIHNYDRGGYDKIPVRLKWPNDIYARDPSAATSEDKFVKIGGILINSSYSGGDYTLVCGIGLNVANAAPTTSLNLLAQKLHLPPFALEKLLASILVQFESLYTRFCRTGFDRGFEKTYYNAWLHSGQIVTLETEGGARARIQGITTDWGLLVAEELGAGDQPTGKRWQLQSDSNSFDFFKGLLKRKL